MSESEVQHAAEGGGSAAGVERRARGVSWPVVAILGFQVVLLALLYSFVGRYPVVARLATSDAVAFPGETVRLEATLFVDRAVLLPGAEEAEVTFAVKGARVGGGPAEGVPARLEKGNLAVVSWKAPETVGPQELEVRARPPGWGDDCRLVTPLRLEVLAAGARPIVATMESLRGRRPAPAEKGGPVGPAPPRPGSRELLASLAAAAPIIYVETGSRLAVARSRRWLREQRYPAGPLLSIPPLEGRREADWRAIRDGLRARVLSGKRKIAWAFVADPAETRAAAALDLRTVLVSLLPDGAVDESRVRRAADWGAAAKIVRP